MRFVLNATLPNNVASGNYPDGKTALYSFQIMGQEAVSYAWFERVLEVIKAADGTIETQTLICKDLEN
jgi:hypothetical protein